jgi:hypothetical protein
MIRCSHKGCLRRARYFCTEHREHYCPSHWFMHLAAELRAAGKKVKMMRGSAKLGLITLFAFLAAVCALALCAPPASPMDIFQPGVTTIMGASVCTGSPTTDALLVYGGSTWCGSTVNNAPLISGTASSLTIKSAAGNGAYVTVEPNGTTSGFAIGGSGNGSFFVYDNAAGIAAMQYAPSSNVLEVAPIGWDRGADLTQTNESRTPLTLYSPVDSTGTLSLPIDYAPSVLMHVRRWTLLVNPAPSGCSTWPVYEIQTDAGAQSASAISLATVHTGGSVTGLSLPIGGSGFVEVAVTTQGVGCTWSSGALEAIMELTTD